MKPVSGGRPPRDNMVRITRAILIGDSWAVFLRWPNVNTFKKSKSKKMEVLITR